MVSFKFFSGTVTTISDFPIGTNDDGGGCYKFMTVVNRAGDTVNFVVSPSTYFLDYEMVLTGDRVTGYYDGNAPVPLIFPPQYQALVVVKNNQRRNVKIDYFDDQLTSSDNQLKLNISPYTRIITTNGQAFTRTPANRNLVVSYGPSTKSIPAQTSPYQIVVLCL